MRTFGIAAGAALTLLLAGCAGTENPPAPSSSRATQAPTVTSQQETSSVTATPTAPAMMDDTRAALMRQTVPSLAGVDTPRLVGLADSMCRQLGNGVAASQLFQAALRQQFTEQEAFGLLSASVVTTCPGQVGKVTYDTVHWHP